MSKRTERPCRPYVEETIKSTTRKYADGKTEVTAESSIKVKKCPPTPKSTPKPKPTPKSKDVVFNDKLGSGEDVWWGEDGSLRHTDWGLEPLSLNGDGVDPLYGIDVDPLYGIDSVIVS